MSGKRCQRRIDVHVFLTSYSLLHSVSFFSLLSFNFPLSIQFFDSFLPSVTYFLFSLFVWFIHLSLFFFFFFFFFFAAYLM